MIDLFSPKGFLDIAEWLSHHDSESESIIPSKAALSRTSISRAYYAVHLQARVFARNRFGSEPLRGGEVHGKLIQEFKRNRRFDIAANINELRRKREHADYHTEDFPGDDCDLCQSRSLTQDLLSQTIDLAKKTFNKVAAS